VNGTEGNRSQITTSVRNCSACCKLKLHDASETDSDEAANKIKRLSFPGSAEKGGKVGGHRQEQVTQRMGNSLKPKAKSQETAPFGHRSNRVKIKGNPPTSYWQK
jgi:hypothetical protein